MSRYSVFVLRSVHRVDEALTRGHEQASGARQRVHARPAHGAFEPRCAAGDAPIVTATEETSVQSYLRMSRGRAG